jgi:AcrR family transcriptional regulator
VIVAAAFRVADARGIEGLTFQALGAELQAHPTAIYRHFRSKDDLILALVDALHAESLEGLPPSTDDWAADLMEIAMRMHAAFMRHPKVGAIAAPRTARREHEFRSVELKLGCMLRAGLDLDDAARYHRVFADVILCYSAMDASLAALDAPLRRGDLLAWSTDYSRLPAEEYPNISAIAGRFASPDDPENYRTAITAIIDAIRARAAQTARPQTRRAARRS